MLATLRISGTLALQASIRSASTMPLSEVPDVDLDPKGVFKYILIKCVDKETKEEKNIVRGYDRCTFHADILEETREATPKSFKLKCIGGGRVKHDPDLKDIYVYGYSQGYGQADHSLTVAILKKHYAGYSVTFSNDGY